MSRVRQSHHTQIWLVGAVFILLTCMTLIEFTRSRNDGPRELRSSDALAVTADTFSVGAVPPGSRCPISVTLVNSGPQPLRILKIRPSCTCVDFSLDRDTLASGESGNLEIVMNAPATDGAFDGTIGVEYAAAAKDEGDGARRELYIAVDGTVIGGIRETAD